MAVSFQFYRDAELTEPLTYPLVACQEDDGSSDPVIFQIWLGSPAALGSKRLYSESQKGIAPITLTVVDSVAGGLSPSNVTLADTLEGLDQRQAGAPLELDPYILSGSQNAKPVWIRMDDTTYRSQASNELTLQTQGVREEFV